MRDVASASGPIEQQVYTRERHGIFRPTEGFDTVAKSEGLDPSFIKKVLHPFCVYDAPAELLASGEKDGRAYPESIHVFHTDSGEAVIGRNIYQPADFTGLRSAMFSHNYVLSSASRDAIVEDYAQWIYTDFMDHYDVDQGVNLPSLLKLPVQKDQGGSPADQPYTLLEELCISEQTFKQLIYTVMLSASGGRKVYIALDVPASYISTAAQPLLELIYRALPWAYRRMLGFTTYAKEPQSRKGIHISFVERGSLRPGDRSIEKDYIYDLATGRNTSLDLDWAQQPYLDLVWDRLDRPQELENFYRFADDMVQDMGVGTIMSVASYHELCRLYQIEAGDSSEYVAHQSAILRSMLDYLSPPGALRSKERLNDLFLAIFDQEFDALQVGQSPDVFVAECFRDYYALDPRSHERKIVEYFMRALLMARNEPELFHSLYALIDGNVGLHKAFFNRILSHSEIASLLFIPYLQNKLEGTTQAKEIVSLVLDWDRFDPNVWKEHAHVEILLTTFEAKLKRERDLAGAVQDIESQLSRSSTTIEKTSGRGESGIRDLLDEAAQRILLTELDLERLTPTQMNKISFIQKPERASDVGQRQRGQVNRNSNVDIEPMTSQASSAGKHREGNKEAGGPQLRTKRAVLKALHQWFGSKVASPSLFDPLSPGEMEQVQRIGRRWLRDEVNQGQFENVALAFCVGGTRDAVDFAMLVDGLRRMAATPEVMYQFFAWSNQEPSYVLGKSRFHGSYEKAIYQYFKKYDADALKKRSNWKTYFSTVEDPLKSVYEKARLELTSPLSRILRKPFMLIAFIVVIGALGTWSILQLTHTPEPAVVVPPVVDKPVTPPASEKPKLPERAVYAAQVTNAKGKTMIQLHFLFSDAEACRALDTKIPLKVNIRSTGTENTGKDYTLRDVISSCAAGTPSTAISSTAAPSAGNEVTEESKVTDTPSTISGMEGKPNAGTPESSTTTGNPSGGVNGTSSSTPSGESPTTSSNKENKGWKLIEPTDGEQLVEIQKGDYTSSVTGEINLSELPANAEFRIQEQPFIWVREDFSS
ncbi:hypothetical protein J2Z69_001824 [Paenibacillus shirakamiensis]|uniref:Glycosyltransferase n=1 Tax=Paenibacillus shirakamiensis TaxID=1265935 RepID=A0ABS4JGE4_9BACL|nr:hypothetical protein [Paenibacillus shirakamiensis]